MKKWTKKLAAVLTIALLVCAMMPATAFAAYYWTEGAEENYDQFIQMGEPVEYPCQYTIVYHANYDYANPEDDVTYTVGYIGGSNVYWPLLTAEDCGFTASGYMQNTADPWFIPDDWLSEYNEYADVRSGFQEFDFKDGNFLGGVHGDSTTGYFWTMDGAATIHLYANWTTTGDPVDIPDPVEPKPEKPVLEKQVEGGDSTSAYAGESVNFTLTSNVPADLWKCFDFGGESGVQTFSVNNRGAAIDGAEYHLTFHDTMAQQLTMDDGSLSVTIGETPLTADQYTYTTSTGDDCTFHVNLDLVDLYRNNVITDADYENQTPIVVSYNATLASDATAGTYENTSSVSWNRKIVERPNPTDPVDPDNPPENPDDPDNPPGSEEDTVDVYTYKIQLTKTDKDTNEALAGAAFKLEKNEGNDSWTTIGSELTTDTNGIVAWDGLEEGTYRLTETNAPEGYVKDSTPVKITLPDNSNAETKIANVSFTNGSAPHTGGSGTMIYTIVGLVILGGAAVIFVVSRRKSRG